jgi:hypothetical protein
MCRNVYILRLKLCEIQTNYPNREPMAYIIGGETAEPANKRARLESVIPVRSTPSRRPNLCSPRRLPGRYRPRSGCPASCRPTNAATHTREASSAGGEAANSKEEANPDPRECPPPRGGARGGPRGGRPGRW